MPYFNLKYMLTKNDKKRIIENLTNKLKKEKLIILVDFSKLSVNDLSKLKKDLKKVDAEFQVIKKTLLQIVFKNLNFNIDLSQFKAPCAIIINYKDEIEPTKIVYNFSKSKKVLEILGGFLNKNFIDKNQVIKLARLSSRNDQLILLIRTMNTPLIKFINLQNTLIKNFIYTLNSIINKAK